MSTSTDGILAYGYDLSGEDCEIEFVDADGTPLDEHSAPTWYDDENEDEGFAEQAIDWLLAAAFLAGKAEDHDLYKDRSEAEALLGVEIVEHCSGVEPRYLLAAKVITAHRGSPKVIDLSLATNADERLSWALGVLGIKPRADKPAWLLASYWGGP